jgi:hypothetical protein
METRRNRNDEFKRCAMSMVTATMLVDDRLRLCPAGASARFMR